MPELMLHAGSRLVERDELAKVPVPEPTKSWFPVAHVTVLDRVVETLGQAGFEVAQRQLSLSRGNARMFAVLRLTAALAPDVSLVIGARNSLDKSFPISFCAGSSVLVCDNLSFSSEIMVTRKHTRHGVTRFAEDIALAVQRLEQYQETERVRIQHYQRQQLSEPMASHLLIQAFEGRIISARQLPDVLQQWHKPTYQEFSPRSLWSLLNAFTTAMGDRQKSNPQAFAKSTIRLSSLLDQAVDMSTAAEPNHVVSA